MQCGSVLSIASCIVASASVASWYWPWALAPGGPIGNISIHTQKICDVYQLIAEETPGLASPPDLYEHLGVVHSNQSLPVRIWKASASKAEKYILGYRSIRQQRIFLDSSNALMDEALRSVYNDTFWPIIKGEKLNKRNDKLKEICGWGKVEK